jgi:hypothetical protein
MGLVGYSASIGAGVLREGNNRMKTTVFGIMALSLLMASTAHGLQGSAADCNGNGLLDTFEIASGRAFDINDNLIPDECELSRPQPVIRAVGVNRGPLCGFWTTGSVPGVWRILVSQDSPDGPWINGNSSGGEPDVLEAQLRPGLNTLYLRKNPNGCGSPIWGLGLWLAPSLAPQISASPGSPAVGYSGILNSAVTGAAVPGNGLVHTQSGGWTVKLLDYSVTSASQIVSVLKIHASPCGSRSHLSPELTPFSFTQSRSWLVQSVDPGATEVFLRVNARGALGTATRFLTVRVDGVALPPVFGAGSGASTCAAAASVASIPIPNDLFSAVAADGQIEIRVEPSLNATSDGCDAATLTLALEYLRAQVDCDTNGVDDECELGTRDCNQNFAIDSCDIADGTSADVNSNGIPDECEVDCNGNDLPDSWELSQSLVPDCNQNGIPDSCDISSGGSSADVDANGVPDECKADCNDNDLPDAYEIAQGLAADCDLDTVLDACQIATDPQFDCNTDGVLDSCQGGPDGSDCNQNGVPDVCDILNGADDENDNDRLDACELRFGDLNLDGQVNGTDLAGLLAVWGFENPPYGDLDGDGQVGGADLTFLLARWGPVP